MEEEEVDFFKIFDAFKVLKAISPIEDLICSPVAALDDAEVPEPVEQVQQPVEATDASGYEATPMEDSPSDEAVEEQHEKQQERLGGHEAEHEEERLVEERNQEEQEEDLSYFSPASPSPCDMESETAKSPKIIPLTSQLPGTVPDSPPHETSASSLEPIVKQLIMNYSQEKYQTVLATSTITPSNAEAVQIFGLRKCIEKHCVSSTEWTSEAVTTCISQMLSQSKRPKLLALALLEVIEDSKDRLYLDFTPPGPAMSRSLQKCFVLLTRLEGAVASFRKYFESVLEQSLFSLSQTRCNEALTNLTHFYLTCIEFGDSANEKIIYFIYKCLYFYPRRATPLVYAAVMAHPMCLPHANDVENVRDPLVRTITSVLMCTPYMVLENKGDDLRKKDMFNVLKRRYGYFADKTYTAERIVEDCVHCIRNGQLSNVHFALILLVKHKGFEWGHKHIVQKHLEPLLFKYITSDVSIDARNDQRIDVLLCSIASITRACPEEINVDYYLDIFDRCLHATNRATVQQASIAAICQMSRFSTEKTYRKLENWRPNYVVDPRVMATLTTFVHKQNKRFWFNEKKIRN